MLIRLWRLIAPPPRWRPAVVAALGAFCGIGLLTIHVSNATSYLSDAPETCMNCHVMAPQFASWMHSAHRQWAHCNDCHVPHNSVIDHYLFKAEDGLRHSYIFTLGMEPQVIRLHKAGAMVVQQNCIRCHSSLLEDTSLATHDKASGRYCWDCHRETPHGRQQGLSSAPYARVPHLGSMIPKWLKPNSNSK